MRSWCSAGIGTPNNVGATPLNMGAVCVWVAVTANRSRFKPVLAATSIGGDYDGGALLFIGKSQGLGPDPLRHSFGLGSPKSKATQAHWILGGNVDFGHPNRKLRRPNS
jgi:hypothetical protein